MGTRRSIAAAAALASAALLAACGLGPTGPAQDQQALVTGKVEGQVSLQTWSLKPKFTQYVQSVVDGFEQEHPGVTVTWLDQPGDGYSEKVLSQAASGELPDVTNLPPEFAVSLVEQGLLLDVAGSDDTLEQDYVQGGLGAYRYEGHEGTFGYPWYLGTDVNYWNSELMSQNGLDPNTLPTSLDELIAQAKVMKEASGGTAYLMSRKPGLDDLTNAGVKLLSDDGSRFVFNTPEAAALLDTYRDAYSQGLMPRDVLSSGYQGNGQLFNQEKVAWTTGGGNLIRSIREDNPSLAEKIVPSPAFGTAPLYVQGLSVSARSANLPAAVALARWVTSPENQAKFAELAPGFFPSTTATAQDPFFSTSDGTPAADAKVMAFETLRTAELLHPVTFDESMSTFVDQQFALAISGEIDSRAALDAAVEKCNQLLAD